MKLLIVLLMLVTASYASTAFSCDSLSSCTKFSNKLKGWTDCVGLKSPVFFEFSTKKRTVTITTVLAGTDVCKMLAFNTTVINSEKVFMFNVVSGRDGKKMIIAFSESCLEIRCSLFKSDGTETLNIFHVKDFAVTPD